MSEAELQPDHLHSTCPEKAAGLQPPSSASAAAPTHLASRAASLTTKCLQWPLHALTGICDGHALCQNYPFVSHFSSQVLMHFCIWRSLQVGGCVCLGASWFLLWSPGSPMQGHITLVLVRPKQTDTIVNCSSFLAFPSHIEAAVLCHLQSFSPASLQLYLMPLLEFSIDFCCCVTQSIETLHSARFKQEKNVALVTP